MAAREQFEGQLKDLHDLIIQLGKFTEEALKQGMLSLKEGNAELALRVLEEDEQANYLEEKINTLAMNLIIKQQPVATDLRKIVTAIKISADLERMADYAVNIAKSSIRVGKPVSHTSFEKIEEMFSVMIGLVHLSVEAFQQESVELAKQVSDIDDDVDNYYGIIIKELMSKVPESKEDMQLHTQLAFVIRYIERVADHATNIAENVYYLVKGTHYSLNK